MRARAPSPCRDGGRARSATRRPRRVDELEELEVVERRRREALPAHAALDVDRRAIAAAHDDGVARRLARRVRRGGRPVARRRLRRRSPSRKNASTGTSSASASANSVETDGRDCPRSIWLIRLARPRCPARAPTRTARAGRDGPRPAARSRERGRARRGRAAADPVRAHRPSRKYDCASPRFVPLDSPPPRPYLAHDCSEGREAPDAGRSAHEADGRGVRLRRAEHPRHRREPRHRPCGGRGAGGRRRPRHARGPVSGSAAAGGRRHRGVRRKRGGRGGRPHRSRCRARGRGAGGRPVRRARRRVRRTPA